MPTCFWSRRSSTPPYGTWKILKGCMSPQSREQAHRIACLHTCTNGRGAFAKDLEVRERASQQRVLSNYWEHLEPSGCPLGEHSARCLTAVSWSRRRRVRSWVSHLVSEHLLPFGTLVQLVSPPQFLVFPSLLSYSLAVGKKTVSSYFYIVYTELSSSSP